jgi:hypothetical protein
MRMEKWRRGKYRTEACVFIAENDRVGWEGWGRVGELAVRVRTC